MDKRKGPARQPTPNNEHTAASVPMPGWPRRVIIAAGTCTADEANASVPTPGWPRHEPWFAENLHWVDVEEWWQSPATAYLAGLVHGAQLERERQARDDDAEHRAAVRRAVRIIETAEARERAS